MRTAAPAEAGSMAVPLSASTAAKASAFVTFVKHAAVRADFASFAMAVFN